MKSFSTLFNVLLLTILLAATSTSSAFDLQSIQSKLKSTLDDSIAHIHHIISGRDESQGLAIVPDEVVRDLPRTKKRTMTSKNASAPAVPIIDLSALTINKATATEAEKAVTVEQIKTACVEIGFFVIVNHGLDQSVVDRMWNITRSFFDLSESEKLESAFMNKDYPYGYEKGEVLAAGKQHENGMVDETPPDYKETFTIGPENPLSGMPSRKMPSNPPMLAEYFTDYYGAMEGLAATLLQAFALGLDLPVNFFEDKIDHHSCALRTLNYPHQDTPPLPNQLRAGAHTDYGSLTILKSGGPGLQVRKDVDGEQWVDVVNVEGGFIVNLGDLMKRWTNDKYSSTLHRVINPPRDESIADHRRQSIAFFHNINGDAIVETIESCRDANGGSKYGPIKALDHLLEKHYASVKNVVGDDEKKVEL
jgi:isopenicillin N synthase-like dioxygenase